MLTPKRFAMAAWLAVLLHAATPAEAAILQTSAAALRALDERVVAIGHRLAVAGRPLCADRQWQPGFVVHDLSQYPRGEHRALVTSLRLDQGPGVLALVDDGPAATAGLRRDDVLVAADGNALPRPPLGSASSFAPAERIIEALEQAFSDGRAELRVRRDGTDVMIDVPAVLGCASRFQVIPSSRLNAHADGRYVQLTSAIVEFAADDQELAALIAHELSHNILRHRVRLNAAGIDRGLLQNFGRSARLTRSTELEADRYAVYLLARAGYDPFAGARFNARLGRRTTSLFAATHPNWRDRVAAIEAEARRVQALQQSGADLRPGWATGAALQ